MSEVMTAVKTKHNTLYCPRSAMPPAELWQLIRERYCEEGVSKKSLATHFACSVATIGSIVNG